MRPLYKTPRPVACAAAVASYWIQGESLCLHPLQYIQVAGRSCVGVCLLVPGAAVSMGPYKYFEVTFGGCLATHVDLPWTAVSSCPFKRAQFPSHRSCYAHTLLVQGAVAGQHPFENVNVPVYCGQIPSVPRPAAPVANTHSSVSRWPHRVAP